MEIYLYMLFFAVSFYAINKTVYNEIIEKLLFSLMFVMLFIISAIRKHVGTDYGVYLNVYSSIQDRIYDGEGMEIGYFYLNKITKDLIGGEYTIFIVTSLIIMLLVYLTIKNFSVDPLLSTLLFMCIGTYIGSFNIIRQSIAIALILYSYKYCETKIIWIIPILVASLFHTTALMVIPFYIISKMNLKKEHYIIIGIVGVLLYLSYGRTVAYLTNFIEGFEHYQDSKFVTEGANPIRTLISIFILLFCYLSYDEINEDRKIKFAFTMMVFGSICALFMLKGKIFARVVGYFDVFNILVVPYVVAKTKKYELRKFSLFVTISIVFCCSYYFYYSIKTNQGDVIPYKTYISEIREGGNYE